MAVTATFIADLTSFNRAVDGATVRLKSFESGAGRVEKALSRVGDSYSGRRTIQEATLAAKAVEKIGGVSKLTESEQRRLNSTVTEAIAKYRALGQQVPRNLQEIERATRRVETSTGGLTTRMVALGSAIGTFAGSLAADAVRKLGREVLELATNGIKMAPVVESFERLTASIGASADAMLNASRTATKGLITDLEVMQAANKAILLGLPVTEREMGVLAETAVVLGKAMGQGAGQSLNDLIVALGRSSPLILDNLGLTVKLGEANQKFAAEIGKSASELTDAEKKLAFYNAAMDAARKRVEDLGGVHLTLADRILSVQNSFKNWTDALGVAINLSPSLGAAFGFIGDEIAKAFGGNQVARVQRLTEAVNQFALVAIESVQIAVSAFRLFAPIIEEQVPILANLAEGWSKVLPDAMAQHMKMTAENIRSFANMDKALDSAQAKLESMKRAMVEAAGSQVDSATIAEVFTEQTEMAAEATEKQAKATGSLIEQLTALEHHYGAVSAPIFTGAGAGELVNLDTVVGLLQEQGQARAELLEIERGSAVIKAQANALGEKELDNLALVTESLKRVPSVWDESLEFMKDSTAAAVGDMLSGLRGFGDGVKDIWRSIQQSVSAVISDIVRSWLQGLLTMRQGQGGFAQSFGMTGGVGGGSFLGGGGSGIGGSIVSDNGIGGAGASAWSMYGAGAVAGGVTGLSVGYQTASKTKGALSGAATGALTGFAYGGPYGALIGAGVGAFGGIVGGSMGGAREQRQLARSLDEWMERFGGPIALQQQLGVHDDPAASALYRALVRADTAGELKQAQAGILNALAAEAQAEMIASGAFRTPVGTVNGAPIFHTGGFVPGSGEVNAKLLGGEGVLSRKGMKALDDLNTGRAPDDTRLQQTLDRIERALSDFPRANAQAIGAALVLAGRAR